MSNDEEQPTEMQVSTIRIGPHTFVNSLELTLFLGSIFEAVVLDPEITLDEVTTQSVGVVINGVMETLLESHELALMLAPDLMEFIDEEKFTEYNSLLDSIKDK